MSSRVADWARAIRTGRVVRRHAGELAHVLLTGNLAAARRMASAAYAETRSVEQVFATLLEPAARVLGDLWSDDVCDGRDLSIAAAGLQLLSHHLPTEAATSGSSLRQAILVASQPGEIDILCAVLHAELYGRAGFLVQLAPARTESELVELLSCQRFDVLDLCLGALCCRFELLPRMARTIAAARAASCNRDLAVIASGRCFFQRLEAPSLVGADAVCRHATDAVWMAATLRPPGGACAPGRPASRPGRPAPRWRSRTATGQDPCR
jgi:hypothetical protein